MYYHDCQKHKKNQHHRTISNGGCNESKIKEKNYHHRAISKGGFLKKSQVPHSQNHPSIKVLEQMEMEMESNYAIMTSTMTAVVVALAVTLLYSIVDLISFLTLEVNTSTYGLFAYGIGNTVYCTTYR